MTETEQRKEEKRAFKKRPAEYLEAQSHLGHILPSEACNLIYHGIMAVCVGPALPRFDTCLCIGYEKKRRQRNGPK